MRTSVAAIVAVSLGYLAGCTRDGKSREPAIAQAFVGPVTLKLRKEISPDSATTVTVNHGEKVDVLQVRRRFIRVRDSQGQQGWTDSRNLLTAEQMAAIGELAKTAARLPSQGQAAVYSALNVHTDPSRQSTSFFQINESMRVDVVAHRITPRNSGQNVARFQVPKPAPPPRRSKPKKEPKYPPPPMPPAPALPPNWVGLSKTELPPEPAPPVLPLEAEGKKAKRRAAEKPAVPMEDWYLIRTKDGKAGWVLARMVYMAIPDEVAQYSEGARITSYFPLKEVYDGDQKKHHWIWTTMREGSAPYQFDGFRVFTYVVRRHRYETAFIARNIEGYYPIEVKPGAMPTFSLIMREADGNLYRTTYVLEGYLVRKIAEAPYKKPVIDAGEQVISKLPDEENEPDSSPSIADRIRSFFRRGS